MCRPAVQSIEIPRADIDTRIIYSVGRSFSPPLKRFPKKDLLSWENALARRLPASFPSFVEIGGNRSESQRERTFLFVSCPVLDAIQQRFCARRFLRTNSISQIFDPSNLRATEFNSFVSFHQFHFWFNHDFLI